MVHQYLGGRNDKCNGIREGIACDALYVERNFDIDVDPGALGTRDLKFSLRGCCLPIEMAPFHRVKVDENVLIPTLGGLRLACKLWQVADGRRLDDHSVKLICYPGWLDNSGSWDRAAEILCKQYGFAVLAIDPPGCGLSDHRPLSTLYNDFEEAPLIADVADAIGWQTFGLLGHSRGGEYKSWNV
jgi:alpha/beta hydrolase fold